MRTASSEPGTDRYAAAVADFSDRFLPIRGWRRVLLAGPAAGHEAVVLVRKGYDVTVAGGADGSPASPAFDVVLTGGGPADRRVLRELGRLVRPRGLLIGSDAVFRRRGPSWLPAALRFRRFDRVPD